MKSSQQTQMRNQNRRQIRHEFPAPQSTASPARTPHLCTSLYSTSFDKIVSLQEGTPAQKLSATSDRKYHFLYLLRRICVGTHSPFSVFLCLSPSLSLSLPLLSLGGRCGSPAWTSISIGIGVGGDKGSAAAEEGQSAEIHPDTDTAGGGRAACNGGGPRMPPPTPLMTSPPLPPPPPPPPLSRPLFSPPRRGGGDGGGPGRAPPAGPNREIIMCGLAVPLIQAREQTTRVFCENKKLKCPGFHVSRSGWPKTFASTVQQCSLAVTRIRSPGLLLEGKGRSVPEIERGSASNRCGYAVGVKRKDGDGVCSG